MAQHASALKAHRASQKRKKVAAAFASRVKKARKAFLSASEGREALLPSAQSLLMRSVRRGVMTKKKASRLISRMALKLKVA